MTTEERNLKLSEETYNRLAGFLSYTRTADFLINRMLDTVGAPKPIPKEIAEAESEREAARIAREKGLI